MITLYKISLLTLESGAATMPMAIALSMSQIKTTLQLLTCMSFMGEEGRLLEYSLVVLIENQS